MNALSSLPSHSQGYPVICWALCQLRGQSTSLSQITSGITAHHHLLESSGPKGSFLAFDSGPELKYLTTLEPQTRAVNEHLLAQACLGQVPLSLEPGHGWSHPFITTPESLWSTSEPQVTLHSPPPLFRIRSVVFCSFFWFFFFVFRTSGSMLPLTPMPSLPMKTSRPLNAWVKGCDQEHEGQRHLGDTVGWVVHSWFPLRSWSEGYEMEPHIGSAQSP